MSSINNNFNNNNFQNNNSDNDNDNIQKNIRILKSSEVVHNLIDEANNTIINYGIKIFDIYTMLKEKHGFTPEQASRFLNKKARVSVTNRNWTIERLFDGFEGEDNNNNNINNSNSTFTKRVNK